ncbi:hypothetical protein AMECASPLE_034185 [Ameca splendens]|uniref:Uncharacterized protein n=1 Tax=Ameca splendens TaxID=208324 RepID=A0ABV0YJ68_9TELE
MRIIFSYMLLNYKNEMYVANCCFLNNILFIIFVKQHLGELVLSFLSRELQPSCLLACLETVRILTRDKHCMDPFISRSAMLTLARYAGIAIAHPAAPARDLLEESEGN